MSGAIPHPAFIDAQHKNLSRAVALQSHSHWVSAVAYWQKCLLSFPSFDWVSLIMHRLQCCDSNKKNTFHFHPYHHGVSTSSHRPRYTSLTIITLNGSSLGMHCKTQHASLVVSLPPVLPCTSLWSLTSRRLPFMCALRDAPTCRGVLCNTSSTKPVGEPHNMGGVLQ